MTKHEDERLAVVETKIDNIIEDIADIKKSLSTVGAPHIELMQMKDELKETKENQKNFISKVGFYTVSALLGIIIIGITILQFYMGR